MKPLHIIQLGKYYPPATGGIETHTQTLCRGLAARGHRVEVLVVNHATASGQDVTFERFGTTPSRLDTDGPIVVHRVGRFGNLAKLDLAPRMLAALTNCARSKPDIWHLHTPNITLMLAMLATPRSLLRPLVITHHSDIIKQRLLKPLVQPFQQALYRRADLILSTNPTYIGGSEELRRHLSRVDSLPLGLDLPVVSASEPCNSRTPLAEPVWLCVGRLVYYKAIDVALQALRQLPGRLRVIGTGPMLSAWQKLAQELGVADRVEWQGRVSDAELRAAYQTATAFWFPSNARSEGYGLVQVEAMAWGCPVINTAIPHSGVSWVSVHEQTGLTIPPNDVAALVAASQRLLHEPGLRDRLSAEARRQAMTRFNSNLMAERAEAFYRQVLGR